MLRQLDRLCTGSSPGVSAALRLSSRFLRPSRLARAFPRYATGTPSQVAMHSEKRGAQAPAGAFQIVVGCSVGRFVLRFSTYALALEGIVPPTFRDTVWILCQSSNWCFVPFPRVAVCALFLLRDQLALNVREVGQPLQPSPTMRQVSLSLLVPEAS